MAAGATWIEVALNGPWGRGRQPGIPVTVEEIVADGLAAAAAGAAIVHLHAYDPATGRQRDDWQTYARVIEGIRARSDALVYPTIPLAGSSYADAAGAASPRRPPATSPRGITPRGNDGTAPAMPDADAITPGDGARFAHVEELARRGLIELAVVDPGSTNFLRLDEADRPGGGFVYRNAPEEVRAGLQICARRRVRPGYAIYEPGFTRLGAALARAVPGLPVPVYRFMFSDEFAWGFPPRERYLEAHLALLAETAPGAPWMVAGLGVDIRPLIGAAVVRGGHVRVGLEDAPWGSGTANRAWVEAAARAVREVGGEPATPGQVRAALAVHDAPAR